MELNLPHDRTFEETVSYVRMIETFYMDKMAHFRSKTDQVEKERRRERLEKSQKVERSRDLEKILDDAVETTRKRGVKKMKAEEKASMLELFLENKQVQKHIYSQLFSKNLEKDKMIEKLRERNLLGSITGTE